MLVTHRIGGLENKKEFLKHYPQVTHRIGGLENWS